MTTSSSLEVAFESTRHIFQHDVPLRSLAFERITNAPPRLRSQPLKGRIFEIRFQLD